MLKFIAIFVVCIVYVIFRKRIKKFLRTKFGLVEALVSYTGGITGYWAPYTDPDAYNTGNRLRWGQRFKRIEYHTGRGSLNTPAQAFGTCFFFHDTFKLKRDGAKLVQTEHSADERNGIKIITWFFDKSPYKYGITRESRDEIIDSLIESFDYKLADKWPITVERVPVRTDSPAFLNRKGRPEIPQDDIDLVERIQMDIRLKGWRGLDNRMHSGLPEPYRHR